MQKKLKIPILWKYREILKYLNKGKINTFWTPPVKNVLKIPTLSKNTEILKYLNKLKKRANLQIFDEQIFKYLKSKSKSSNIWNHGKMSENHHLSMRKCWQGYKFTICTLHFTTWVFSKKRKEGILDQISYRILKSKMYRTSRCSLLYTLALVKI